MVLQNKKTSDVNVDKIFVETKRSSQYLNDDLEVQMFRSCWAINFDIT